METWLPWLTAIGLVITFITAAAAAVAYFRATSARATIEIQAQTITSYEQRLSQVETELAHYKADSIAKTAENEVLKQALSGKADTERLELLVDNHHRQVMDDRAADREAARLQQEALLKVLGDLADGQRQIKGMLGARRGGGGS